MEGIKCKQVGQLEGAFEMANRVYSPDGLCPTIRTMQGGGLEPKTVEDFYKNREAREYEGVSPTLRSERRGLKVVEPLAYDEQNGYMRQDGTVGTLTCDGSSPKHNNRVVEPNRRVRKLTPRECWRLMGFSDEDFDKASKALNDTFYNGKDKSSSQLYKQAGNSIVVDNLTAIFKNLF